VPLRRLREWAARTLSAAITRLSSWLGLALGLVLGLALAMPAAAQTPAFEWRGEGSFPLQYTETSTSRSTTRTTNMIPYLGLTGTATLPSGLIASVFADGGHGRLGSFLDTDNTFASVGTSIAKRWGAFTAGVSFEHTRYFEGTFGEETNIANDVNLFASYRFTPNAGLRIRPSAVMTMRVDDMFAVQRYSAGARIDIEQRLTGPWWFLVSPRIRHLDYVGSDSRRHDTRFAVVAGLRYAINDIMSTRMLAGWESRGSTDPSRDAQKFTIGASLDFDVDFTRADFTRPR